MAPFERPRRPLRKIGETARKPHGAASGPPSSITLLRMEAKRKMALRQRLGLLKNKSYEDDLDEVEKKMLEHELAIAQELQANLLPHQTPRIPGFDINAYYRPSREVGGDYYDFIEIDEDHLGIVVADVSGKGIPGSIVMTETRALMKSEGCRTMSPTEALIRVNRVLHKDIKRGMFVTMFYTVLSISKGILTVSSAGHNPMVLWRHATNTCHLVNTNGLALGIDKGPLFEKTVTEQRLKLHPGDRFVLYTDGVIETMNDKFEPIGQNRFYLRCKQLAEKESGEFISLIISELERYQGKAPQHDDVTLLTCRVAPAPAGKNPPSAAHP